ncbi:MAG: recombinase family protein, partial [Fibrobacterota bacterium]
RILSNPIYIGTYIYGKRLNPTIRESLKKDRQVAIKEGLIPPIIPENTFNQVKKIMDKNKSRPRRSHDSVHILSGLIRCLDCGESLAAYTSHKASSDKYYYAYRCQGHLRKGPSFCSGNNVSKNAIENIVFETIKEIKLYLKCMTIKKEKDDTQEDIRRNKISLSHLLTKKTQLTDLLVEGLVEKEDYKDRISHYNSEIANVKTVISNMEKNADKKPEINPNDLKQIAIKTLLQKLEIRGQKLLLREIISQVRCGRNGAVEIDLFSLPFFYPQALTNNHTGRDSWPPRA